MGLILGLGTQTLLCFEEDWPTAWGKSLLWNVLAPLRRISYDVPKFLDDTQNDIEGNSATTRPQR